MAKVEWSAGIDHVSGALAKPSKSSQHSCTTMLLGTHRTAATTNVNCNRLYLRKPVKRSTPVGADERDNRNRFAAISAAISIRKKDMTKLTQDQAAFKAQKDQAGGIRTMNAWYWKTVGDEYDAQNG